MFNHSLVKNTNRLLDVCFVLFILITATMIRMRKRKEKYQNEAEQEVRVRPQSETGFLHAKLAGSSSSYHLYLKS